MEDIINALELKIRDKLEERQVHVMNLAKIDEEIKKMEEALKLLEPSSTSEEIKKHVSMLSKSRFPQNASLIEQFQFIEEVYGRVLNARDFFQEYEKLKSQPLRSRPSINTALKEWNQQGKLKKIKI